MSIRYAQEGEDGQQDGVVDLFAERDRLILECEFMPRDASRAGEVALRANGNWFDASMSWLYYSADRQVLILTTSLVRADMTAEIFCQLLQAFIQSCAAMHARLVSLGCRLH
ncbi:type III secretion system chaperone [Paludibacterium purpuratum]|uniref:type III secretion system chaperone n=1 Tax=Paludibacterium purpuratum TaxID=1144873 RepID=UPI001AAE07EF|nr:type III secretion system chaperone [Paludibacterium purpuratum]